MDKVFWLGLLAIITTTIFLGPVTEALAVTTVQDETPRICSVAVLVYHRIGYLRRNPTQAERYVTNSPEAFLRHMEYLRDESFQVVPYDDLVGCLTGGKALPEKSVVLTFDDGLASQYSVARPILKEMNFTATFFVVTGNVGTGAAVMDWEQLRTLESEGMTVASHSVTHAWLSRVSDKRLVTELTDSKAKLESELGHPVTLFAYPFGAYDSRVEAAVRTAGYASARSIRHGRNHRLDQIMSVRIVGVTDSIHQFRRALSPQ